MSDDLLVRDALLDLADSPDPDVDAAWERVQTRLHGPVAARGRRRFVVGAAVAAAAAAVVLLAGPSPNEQSVDVGVADGAGTSAPEPTSDSMEGRPVRLPADPVAVLGPEGSVIHLMDPATGEHVSTVGPFGEQRASEAVALSNGDVYLLLQGAEPMLARTRWDGADLEHFIGWQGSSAAGLAIDPAGRTAAVGQIDLEGRSSLVLVDLATAEVRQLRWPDGDGRGRYHQPQELSFSPDGTQLAFVNVHDTDGTEGFDAYVVDVDAASLADARRLSNAGWEDTWDRIGDATFAPESVGGIVAVTRLAQSRPQVRFVEGGPDVGLPPLDGVLQVQATRDHLLVRTEDAWYVLDPDGGSWRPVPFERWTG